MPTSLADFTIVKALGQGVSGICRLVRRSADARLYALKELEMPSDQGEASAVLQEVHILASLEHPFIVRYYDSFVETRKLFLIMEYAPNGSLHSVLQHHQRSGRHVDEDTVWRYALQLLLGLHAIHQRRIVHRDLKPHNIFLGTDDTVKIGDFGVSRLLSGSADMATTLVGSPGYLAPELCSGEPYDEKADIWAFGVTLVELCSLKHPFGGAGSQVSAAPPPSATAATGWHWSPLAPVPVPVPVPVVSAPGHRDWCSGHGSAARARARAVRPRPPLLSICSSSLAASHPLRVPPLTCTPCTAPPPTPSAHRRPSS